MRIWVYILTFLMMSVILIPCSDEPGQNHRMVSEISTQIEHSEDHSHNHDHSTEDTCSPFCYCQCCSFASLTPLVFHKFDIKSIYTDFSTEEIIYSNLYTFGSHNTLFQPPKA